MEWISLLIFVGIIAIFLILKQLGSLGSEEAREYLRHGARVIDVRTSGEYRERHLPGAINIPLDELKQKISASVPDKEQVLLLHCLSGGRSAMGARMLKKMGYTKVFNLGSLGRAEKITANLSQT